MSEIARSRLGVAVHLAPTGALNESSRIEALEAALRECLGSQETQIVVDFTGIPVVNSAALETLLACESLAHARGGSLSVANLNGVLQDVFRITRMHERIASLDDSWIENHVVAEGTETRRIGEILVARRFVTPEQIDKALELQESTGRRMAQVLLDEGWLSERDLLESLSEQLNLPFAWLRPGVYDPELSGLIGPDIARRLEVMPLFRIDQDIYLATSDPQSLPSMETVEDLSGCRVKPVLACKQDILEAISTLEAESSDLAEYMGDLEGDLELVERADENQAEIDEMAAGSPIVKLINGVVLRAVRDGASDIHIEPSRNMCRIRLRVDGLLYTIMTPPLEVHPALASRLKVMANLDIAERRMPQDGRIQVMTHGRSIDLRFSSLPGIFGEKIVLRVLDKGQAILDIDRLGMTSDNTELFRKLLGRSYGLVLVTGPTGSGKTTTLYGALNHVTSDEKNIVTIEDPVEYQIDRINQNQVRDKIGLGFAKILKHVLRQDPDVVMVGEIRERETAQIAVQAALTGHLVLSTLHTNDSIGAVTRLIDMGVEPYLLSSALIGVMAQRLVRGVCPECRASSTATDEALETLGISPDEERPRLVRGRGCTACYDSGYRGRMAIHELIDCDADLQRLIVSNPSRRDLDNYVDARSIQTLRNDGLRRALAGETTIEEVLRVVSS